MCAPITYQHQRVHQACTRSGVSVVVLMVMVVHMIHATRPHRPRLVTRLYDTVTSTVKADNVPDGMVHTPRPTPTPQAQTHRHGMLLSTVHTTYLPVSVEVEFHKFTETRRVVVPRCLGVTKRLHHGVGRENTLLQISHITTTTVRVREVPKQVLGRLGLTGPRLAGTQDALRLVVVTHVTVRLVTNGVNVRWQHTERFAKVCLDVLRCVQLWLRCKRIERNQNVGRVPTYRGMSATETTDRQNTVTTRSTNSFFFDKTTDVVYVRVFTCVCGYLCVSLSSCVQGKPYELETVMPAELESNAPCEDNCAYLSFCFLMDSFVSAF